MRALRRRYGRAARRKALPWRPGDVVRTVAKIPGDPPVFAPADVIVEEIVTSKPSRRRDSFGSVVVTHHVPRVRVSYHGRSLWVDASSLEGWE